jgi:hypothetical protein
VSVVSLQQQRLLAKALSNPMTNSRPFSRPAPDFANGDVEVMTMLEARCGMGNFDRRDLFKVVLVVEGANELHYTRAGIHQPPHSLRVGSDGRSG